MVAPPAQRRKAEREIRDVEGPEAQRMVDEASKVEARERQMLEVQPVEQTHVGEFSRAESRQFTPQVKTFAPKQEKALEAARSGAPVDEVQQLFNQAHQELETSAQDATGMEADRTHAEPKVHTAEVIQGERTESTHVIKEVVGTPPAERTGTEVEASIRDSTAKDELAAAEAQADQKGPTIEAKGVKVADVESEAEHMLAAIPAATDPKEAARLLRDFASRMSGLGVKPEELGRIMKDKMPKAADGKPVVSELALDDAITDVYKDASKTTGGGTQEPNVIPFPQTGKQEVKGAGDELSTTKGLRQTTQQEIQAGVAERETRLEVETQIEAQQQAQYTKTKAQLDAAKGKVNAMITPAALEANPELKAAAEDIAQQSGADVTEEKILQAAQTAGMMEEAVNEKAIVNPTMHEASAGIANAYNTTSGKRKREGLAGSAKALEYEALGKAQAALDPEQAGQVMDAHQAIREGVELTEDQKKLDLLGHDTPEMLDAVNYELIGGHFRNKAGELAGIIGSDEFQEQGAKSASYREFMEGIQPGQEGEVGGINENLVMMAGDMRMRLADDPNALQGPGALDEIAREHLESYKNKSTYSIGDMSKGPSSWEELANAPRDEKYDTYRKLCDLNGIDAVTPEQVAVAQDKKVEEVKALSIADYIRDEKLPATMSENYLSEAVDSYAVENRQERLEYYRQWHLIRTQERREALGLDDKSGTKEDANKPSTVFSSIEPLVNKVDDPSEFNETLNEDLKDQDFRKQVATVMKVQDELMRDFASQGLEVETSDILAAAGVLRSDNPRKLKEDVMTMLALKQELATPDARSEDVLSAAEVKRILGGAGEADDIAKAA